MSGPEPEDPPGSPEGTQSTDEREGWSPEEEDVRLANLRALA